MRKFAQLGTALLAVLILTPSLAWAQASIQGVVRDTSGAVLPGVTVEAASPALIEKVRTTVSDGNGRYQIIDLRPGTYSVTFTLAGFNTVRRDGVALTGSATSQVDAELRVGALEETVTVTGEAPVVDTTNVTRQQVLNSETVNALPSARNYFGLARMIPGTNGGGSDVGGSLIQDVGQSVTVHGSKNTDQRVTANGVNTMTLQAGGNIGGQTPDMGSAAEVTVDTTSLSAELPTGGIRINMIPRDGGNTFSNSTFFSFTNEAMQGDNFSDELRAAGLGTPNKILKALDLNESIGGPFKRDKVWFWFSTRINQVENEAPIFFNQNAFKPNEWLYVPDESRPGLNKGEQYNNSLRVTWQMTPKVKVAGTYKFDKWCNCPNNITAQIAPEAARDRRFPRLAQEHGEITSPITNRLLFEAVGLHLYERWGNMHLRPSTGSITDEQAAILPQMISVVEQSSGLRYRALNLYNNTSVPSFTWRAAMSYVTGTHNIKFGVNNTTGRQNVYNYSQGPVAYRFNNGVPNQITQVARPFRGITDLKQDLGLFIQDRISFNRLTVNLAGRFDWFKNGWPEQTIGPSELTPNRNIVFPADEQINWKDLTYRTGLAYDLFGDGRTAVKVAFNKYLLGQTLNGIGNAGNPSNAMVTSANRTWNDADGDYTPDCDLVSLDANGECGPISNRNFGSAVPSETYDPDLIGGWNHRTTNWEFTTSVQHELARGIAVDVGYFRRIWANFHVTDNLATTAADYTEFSMVVPTTNPNVTTAGQTITGLFNVTPAKFGQVNNLNTLSDKYGKQTEHWDGVDLSLNARLQNGLMLQAGLSTGRTSENNCEIIAAVPELALGTGANAGWRPAQFCDRVEPWITSFKGYGVYTIPTVDVQISGTFRSTKGTAINPQFPANAAYLAANSTLGRTPTGGNITVRLQPEHDSFTDRRNELDVRFGKVFRVNRYRSVVSLDLFNALNTDAQISVNQNFGSYLRPTQILNARVAKITATFEF
ncbi:MAG: carboxypeptidase regulatory-like domain-containing protein [Vicinamibacterales bacterium]